MLPTRQGSVRFFRFAGIDVYVSYYWFIVALIEIQWRARTYNSYLWNVWEYLALFAIVLMHEFGHALACRSVGGKADQIVLWPLGGVAYVDPPPRPGATLWSIAAGPLVNVVLFPILLAIVLVCRSQGLGTSAPDVYRFLVAVCWTNAVLFVFNMLPFYPLDGGQILRSLLWFWCGRAQSLLITSIIGFVGVAGFVLLALWLQNIWMGLIAAFAAFRCWNGYKVAQAMLQLEQAPRHEGFACPSCQAAPPKGPHWVCGRCRTAFDTFETLAVCPRCSLQFPTTRCNDCGAMNPMTAWQPVIIETPPVL